MADDALSDDPIETVRSDLIEFWRTSLDEVREPVGDAMAAITMLTVASEKLRDTVGADTAAAILGHVSKLVRSGGKVSIAVKPRPVHRS